MTTVGRWERERAALPLDSYRNIIIGNGEPASGRRSRPWIRRQDHDRNTALSLTWASVPPEHAAEDGVHVLHVVAKVEQRLQRSGVEMACDLRIGPEKIGEAAPTVPHRHRVPLHET